MKTEVSSQPFFETKVIFPSNPDRFWSNNYPTVALLADGRLFLNWSARDEKKFRIVGAFSSDDGRTWSAPETLIDTPNMDDFDPNLVLARDEIQVYSTTTRQPLTIISDSEIWKVSRKFDGSSWSQPVQIPQPHKYICGKIHIGLTLPDGTLAMPYSWDLFAEEGKPMTSEGTMKLNSGALLSHDNGQTWNSSGDICADPPRTSEIGTGGVCEPGMVLLENGAIYALLRPADTRHWESRSRDGGKTWDVSKPSPLQGHNSPTALWRLRGSSDVLVVWNNAPRHRWPLDVALSQDHCQTWSKSKTLVNPVGGEAAYPTATQTSDGSVVVCWQHGDPNRGNYEIRLARFNRAWLL